jgi:hypothetical protein
MVGVEIDGSVGKGTAGISGVVWQLVRQISSAAEEERRRDCMKKVSECLRF